MDCAATYMCEEIVIEILSRLPAKSLLRFMAVCRLWKSIITSPQFRLHSHRRPTTKLLVHTEGECYSLLEDGYQNRLIYETDFPLKYDFRERVVVIGSDNGLVCISISSRVIIWNPSIRKHVVIPNNPMDDKTFFSIEYASGFGGTTSGGDYKYFSIVGLIHDVGGSWKTEVHIYSLKAGTWRRKYLDWDINGSQNNICALLRGRLHWVGGRDKEISSFELEDEVFENNITVPESIRYHFFIEDVTVIRESLALITTGETERNCTIWVMEEYGDVNSWNKLFNVDLSVENLYERFVRNSVQLLKDGDILLRLVEKEYPFKKKVVTYNPETMKTRESFSSFLQVYGFTNYHKESLVLLADDYHAAADHYYPVRAGGACSSYPLDHNSPMFFHEPATFFLGYYPVWTGGPSFHSYPLFQDQYGSYYAWTGFNWFQVINYYQFVTIQ